MIDKVWYDWQHANSANFWSFGGGSISVSPTFFPDPTFPTGIPPYMNVSSLLSEFRSIDENSPSSRPRCRQMVL